MSDKALQPGHAPQAHYEHEDLSARGVLSFLAGLAIVCVVVYFILVKMFNVMDAYDRRHQTPVSPLATADQNRSTTREVPLDEPRRFPEPRLEVNERTELNGFMIEQENKLNSYGWVDQNAGVAHIPIADAMRLVAQRGLPVRSQAATPAQPPSRTLGAPDKAQAPPNRSAKGKGQ